MDLLSFEATEKLFRHLLYRSLPAAPAVGDWVDGLWEITNLTTVPQSFTVLPDGYFKAVLTRQPGHAPRLTVSGVWTRPHDIEVAPLATVVGIRFRLLAADYLLPGPLPHNAAGPLLPDSWLGAALLTHGHDLAALARHLAQHLAPLRPPPRQRALFALLYRAGGAASITQLAQAAAWSPRQINRYFQARFGLSLKTYGNVLRSYAAARQLRPGNLYATGGYCDQSHGIRELKKHTGATPRQLDQHRHDRFIQLCPPLAPDLCAIPPF